MNWKEFVSLHHQIEDIDIYAIKIQNIAYDTKNNWYDDVITKMAPFEYQVDTYYHNTNILTDSHIETSIKEYLGY
jgi:hypothetical protein